MTIADSAAWRALAAHAEVVRPAHLRQLFAADGQRFERFSLRQDGLLLDFSKQRIDAETLALLHALADAADVEGWKRKMLAGEPINHTEGRAVRHMDLRADEREPPEVRVVRERLHNFCESIHSGKWRGFAGEHITDVVNIGIGGSDLGPRMAVRALAGHQLPDLKIHSVSYTHLTLPTSDLV